MKLGIGIGIDIGIYVLFAICLIILLGIIIYSRRQNTPEYFNANSNLTNQAPMDFSYLTNRNYARDILATYYLDDDKKINGSRVVSHPYMYAYDNNYGYYWWNPLESNTIYKYTGVRL